MTYSEPYVADPTTGTSITKQFIKQFILQYDHLSEQLDGGTPSPQEPLYKTPGKDSTKLYIGRAAKVVNGTNPHEDMWCVRIDLKQAAKQLTIEQRTVLGYRSMGNTVEETAWYMNLTSRQVGYIFNTALDKLAKILDGVVCQDSLNHIPS